MSKISEALNLLEELEQTSGSNAKKEVIKKGDDNEPFKLIFYYAYNPFLMYNLKNVSKPDDLPDKEVSEEKFSQLIELLNVLNKRIVTGNEAIQVVESYFNSLSNLELKWYHRVLRKDLRVGVTAKTFNSVFKKYIPSFDCMLAKSWDKVKRKPEQVVVERKLDGYRLLAFVNDDGSVELKTRNGKDITGFNDIEYDLSFMTRGYVYDGEITGKVDMFSDMQKTVFSHAEDKVGLFHMFDCLPISEFKEGHSSEVIKARKIKLQQFYNQSASMRANPFDDLKVVETSMPMSPDDPLIDKLFEQYLEEGFEGLMIKDANSYYECKRSSSWIKMVPNETFDLKVIDVEEGTGKNAGMLGAIVVDFDGVRVNVGIGFSEKERREIFDNKDDYIGMVAEVKAREVSTNMKNTNSLRFPEFVRFREDKS